MHVRLIELNKLSMRTKVKRQKSNPGPFSNGVLSIANTGLPGRNHRPKPINTVEG